MNPAILPRILSTEPSPDYALLDSGQITDPNELRFLARRLQAMQDEMGEEMQDETRQPPRRTEPAAQSPPGL